MIPATVEATSCSRARLSRTVDSIAPNRAYRFAISRRYRRIDARIMARANRPRSAAPATEATGFTTAATDGGSEEWGATCPSATRTTPSITRRLPHRDSWAPRTARPAMASASRSGTTLSPVMSADGTMTSGAQRTRARPSAPKQIPVARPAAIGSTGSGAADTASTRPASSTRTSSAAATSTLVTRGHQGPRSATAGSAISAAARARWGVLSMTRARVSHPARELPKSRHCR